MHVAAELIDLGYAPLCPHLSYFIHDLYPKDYEVWMAVDLAWVEVAGALLRP